MKISTNYATKKDLLQKIEKRNQKRINNYTGFAPNVPQNAKAALAPAVDSLSRYGERNNYYFLFEKKDGYFKDQLGVVVGRINKGHLPNIDVLSDSAPYKKLFELIINPFKNTSEIVKQIKTTIVARS